MGNGGWRLGRRPGLDGLRGVAIGLVLTTHATFGRFQNGGSVGVTVFFALSGFLITSLLLEERVRGGRISFGGFYLRRARRLLPALAVYLAVWEGMSLTGVGPFTIPPGQLVASALYYANWLTAFTGKTSTPTAITWSLSIEEQFYLLWPLTFLLLRRWPRAQWTLAIGGVAFAMSWRLAMWNGPRFWWQVYYHSETHMDSILAGCILALAVHRFGTSWLRRSIGWVGVAVLAVLLVDPDLTLKYVWEPALAALAACALIGSGLAGGSRWLEWSPLRWLGQRSYALYLWHYPLTVLAGPHFRVFPMWVALVLSLAAAEASWWLIERPFLRRGSADAEEVEVRVDLGAAVVAGN